MTTHCHPDQVTAHCHPDQVTTHCHSTESRHTVIPTKSQHTVIPIKSRHIVISTESRHIVISTESRHIVISTKSRHTVISTESRHTVISTKRSAWRNLTNQKTIQNLKQDEKNKYTAEGTEIRQKPQRNDHAQHRRIHCLGTSHSPFHSDRMVPERIPRQTCRPYAQVPASDPDRSSAAAYLCSSER